MALGEIEISWSSQVSVSFETRQHPFAEASTVFDMQERQVTTTTTTTVTELRGQIELMRTAGSATITTSDNYTTTSYSEAKLGDFCIYTQTKTVVAISISRSGWVNISD